MVIASEQYRAPLIASEAEVERLDTYEDRIPNYENLNYTFIPIPASNQYYNTDEGWIQNINSEQYISPETHLLEVLERLQKEPFLLIDRNFNMFVIVDSSSGKPLLIKTMPEHLRPITTEQFKEEIDFENYDFEENVVDIYTIDKFDQSDLRLNSNQQSLVTPYEDRFAIITLADVNSRRVKDMLYQQIADLVAELGKHIEAEYPEPDSILQHIQPHAIGRWKKDQLQGLNLHIAEHINLMDMMQIIQSSDKAFVEQCGFSSKQDVQNLSSINDVRNAVMHANRSLIHDRKNISKILEAVENCKRITENMSTPN